jgi:hypothetical protein
MRPYPEAETADRDRGESGQDHDVDLGVTEEPEEVLPQDRVAALRGIEEATAVVAVDEQQDQTGRQHGHREQQQHRHDEHVPHEQGHAHQRHAGCPQLERGGDEVDRRQNRARAVEDQTRYPQVLAAGLLYD